MPLFNDPANVEQEYNGNETDAERDEEGDGAVTARNYHATRLDLDEPRNRKQWGFNFENGSIFAGGSASGLIPSVKRFV